MNKKDIFHFEIYIKTTNKTQLAKAILFLIEKNIAFAFNQTEEGDSYSPSVYSLDIMNLSWTENLQELFAILKKEEWSMDDCI